MNTAFPGNRYQMGDPIGRGGLATIYRGYDIQMKRPVAIKVLREVYSDDPKFIMSFQRGAKMQSALHHPNVVHVYDYVQSNGNYFIVMELVEGSDLRRSLRSRGIPDFDRTASIAHAVALGLGAAHQRGIVHRSVVQQNILLMRGGGIKLTGFSNASFYKDSNGERFITAAMTLGTALYYAPEQDVSALISPTADVYALGIVLYDMLTGHPTFDGDVPVAVAIAHIQHPLQPPSQLNPAIPHPLEAITLRCLEKQPEKRYQNGDELARALEALQ